MVIHPGQVVADYIQSLEWTQAEFARRIGITPKTVSKLLNGKASIKPYMAIGLERLSKKPARFWLQLQTDYDLATERLKQ